MEVRLRTQSKRLTIGVLPAPLLISGTLKDPRAAPDPATPAGRGGLAGALAALPTVQLGTRRRSALPEPAEFRFVRVEPISSWSRHRLSCPFSRVPDVKFHPVFLFRLMDEMQACTVEGGH